MPSSTKNDFIQSEKIPLKNNTLNNSELVTLAYQEFNETIDTVIFEKFETGLFPNLKAYWGIQKLYWQVYNQIGADDIDQIIFRSTCHMPYFNEIKND